MLAAFNRFRDLWYSDARFKRGDAARSRNTHPMC
nr:MAG TPA: hypothetical protein [Caudoviricetes sp.]